MMYTLICLRVWPRCTDEPKASGASSSKLCWSGKPSWRPTVCRPALHRPATLPLKKGVYPADANRLWGKDESCYKHPPSMLPKQNPPTLLLFTFSTLFPRVPWLLLRQLYLGRGRSARATKSKGHFTPKMKVYQCLHSFTDLAHSGSDIQDIGQWNCTLGLVVSAWAQTLIHQSLFSDEASERCLEINYRGAN